MIGYRLIGLMVLVCAMGALVGCAAMRDAVASQRSLMLSGFTPIENPDAEPVTDERLSGLRYGMKTWEVEALLGPPKFIVNDDATYFYYEHEDAKSVRLKISLTYLTAGWCGPEEMALAR